MKIDQNRALAILRREVKAASKEGGGDRNWVELIQELESACGHTNLTFFAALGTALLAKSTDIHVDVFALKASDSEHGYSARSLCQHVLAAYAPVLGIDLGVTGREPLNNQPFFAESRITEQLPVKPRAQPALEVLLKALNLLDKMRTVSDSRAALRAFLSVRKRSEFNVAIGDGSASRLSLIDFSEIISEFVSTKSESGRRAQAVVAGLLDVSFGRELVDCGRINDPDRNFPGDVVIWQGASQEKVALSFEVRDKKVNGPDVNHFAVKLLECGVSKAGIVAPCNESVTSEVRDAIKWAEERGIMMFFYRDWIEFLPQSVFWSQQPPAEALSNAAQSILMRAESIEVSPAGLKQWAENFKIPH